MNPSPPACLNLPIIALSDVIKQFGRLAALRGITAEFLSGRLYVIVGDNGAGKTTLLRILAGLSQPTRGRVSILDSTDPRAVREQVGYMAHPSLLYDELSALENLRYFAQLYRINDEQRCRSVIFSLKLDPDLTRPVGEYSQGMRQRLSLARAVLHDPKILLLDEPFSNVDVGSARHMVELLAAMRNRGTTILLITHQASLLESASNEFVWMDFGKIIRRSRELELLQAL